MGADGESVDREGAEAFAIGLQTFRLCSVMLLRIRRFLLLAGRRKPLVTQCLRKISAAKLKLGCENFVANFMVLSHFVDV